MQKIADKTEGYTGADLAGLASTAVMLALEGHVAKYKPIDEIRKNADEVRVTAKHFYNALEKRKLSNQEEKKLYSKLA